MDTSVNMILTSFIIAIVALVSVLFCVLPDLSRRSVFFAVTIDPEFRSTPDARHIIHSFRGIVVLNALFAIALTVVSIYASYIWLAPAGVFWLVIGNYFAFLHGRKSVIPHRANPSSVRKAEVIPRREHLPGGWFAQIGPFFLLTVSAIVLWQHWDAIPQSFPIHWDAYGHPNNFGDKTFLGVFGILFYGGIICAIVALAALGITKRSRKVELRGPTAARDSRVRRYNAIVLVSLEYFLALIFAGTALLPLRPSFSGHQLDLPPSIVGWFMFATLVFVIFVIVQLMRAARTHPDHAAAGASTHPTSNFIVGDSTPDSRWIGGMFYFNREDPALFVEKRFGLGYTLNFGHLISWIVLGLTIALPLFGVLLLPHHR